jgi:hypothetical protein
MERVSFVFSQPMSATTTLSYTIWLSAMIVMAGIVFRVFQTMLWRELPIFAIYTSCQFARSICLLMVRQYGDSQSYFYSYWTAEIVSEILAFLVILEVFFDLLKPYPGIQKVSTILLKWATVMLLLLAFILGAFAAPDTRAMINTILIVEQSAHVVQCGLVLFLLLFSSALSLSWRSYSFGIAAGFGVLATVDVVTSTMKLTAGPIASPSFVILKPVTYLAVSTLWFAYLFRPVTSSFKKQTAPPATDLEQWDVALVELLKK